MSTITVGGNDAWRLVRFMWPTPEAEREAVDTTLEVDGGGMTLIDGAQVAELEDHEVARMVARIDEAELMEVHARARGSLCFKMNRSPDLHRRKLCFYCGRDPETLR
jgi:hypothetical protein